MGGKRVVCGGTKGFAVIPIELSDTATWDMLLELDKKDDEGTCLGIATTTDPASDLQNYEGSTSCHVLRCYNGKVYTAGNSSSPSDARKIHQGDRVRFTLDRGSNSLSAVVLRGNGTEDSLGTLSSSLPARPKKLHPLVIFYASTRGQCAVQVNPTAAALAGIQAAKRYPLVIGAGNDEFNGCYEVSPMFLLAIFNL